MTGAHCCRPATVRSVGPWDHTRQAMGVSFDVDGEVIRLAINDESAMFLLTCLTDAVFQKRDCVQSDKSSEIPNEVGSPAEGQ